MKKTIGIDPDSEKNGVALYRGSTLVELYNLSFIELQEFLLLNKGALVVIEDVMKNTATFSKKGAVTQGSIRKVAYSVGRCAQVGYHLVQFCEHHDIKYVLKPISSMWKKQKSVFERITGYTGRSNEDTRSAAYFGFLEAQKHGSTRK